MKLKLMIVGITCALSLTFMACTNEEGDISHKPGIMQKNDSISQLPPMGDTSLKEKKVNP